MTPTETTQLRSNSKGEQMLLKVGGHQTEERTFGEILGRAGHSVGPKTFDFK
jgi:hypothetical protein